MARQSKKIKLGDPIRLEFSDRYFQFNRQYAVRDVFDGLIELITNSDDSYRRLYEQAKILKDGGPILIEYQEQRRGEASLIRVRDRAEGMTLNGMLLKLGDVGTRSSLVGDRGFMARGAKDCTELGEMLIESIKEDCFYACKLTPRAEIIPLNEGEGTNVGLRERLGIRRGNGTVVTLTVEARHTMPRISTIIRDLPWLFPLRDILVEDGATQVQIINLNDPKSGPEPIVYRIPEGEIIIDNQWFEIPGYQNVTANLTVYKVSEPFESVGDRRFRRSGFLIKGKRAIHECSLLKPEFEKDPNAANYFGRIECSYIDDLLDEYDEYRASGDSFPEHNPRLLIDPNRQTGLIREHPFTQALLQVPSERLRGLIAKDKESERAQRREILNKETKRRLKRLAKVASQFMRSQLEDISELTSGEDVDTTSFSERGVMIVPTFARLKINEEKTLWMYVKKDLVQSNSIAATVHKDSKALEVLDEMFQLVPHKNREDRMVGTFRIRAVDLSDGVYLHVKVNGLPEGEAYIEIVDRGIDKWDFSMPLEFQYAQYSVREGRTRKLRLYALYPDLVDEETQAKVWSEDNSSVVVRGSYKLVPMAGSNFARADVVAQGRKLKSRTTINASVNGRDASTVIRVIEKDQSGVPIEIDIREQDFNNYRAMWADHEGKPNLLLISALHKSVNRYLGPSPKFEGQNSPIFRLLLAEIVAESICRKVLRLDAKDHPWDYRLSDFNDDVAIIETVLARLHRNIRDFVAEAHSIMLSDSEVSQLDVTKL